MGYIFALGIIFFMAYGTELRCALGNKGACQSFEIPLAEQGKKPS